MGLPAAPDDRRIAVITELERTRNNVVVVDVASGREEPIGRHIAYSANRDSRRPIMMRWSGDGRALYWTSISNIGFIGLVAPHLMRPLIGHDPARLLVPSALTGSALLLSADIAVRIIPSTSDIKVGVLTSIIGVPFFLYLIMRERRALSGGVA